MAKNIFSQEIHDGVLCEATESFEAGNSKTSKEEEAKTVEKLVLNGVSLSICVFCCFYSRRVKSIL